jgi:hypothetical protein
MAMAFACKLSKGACGRIAITSCAFHNTHPNTPPPIDSKSCFQSHLFRFASPFFHHGSTFWVAGLPPISICVYCTD